MKDIRKPLLECMDHLHITNIRKEQKSQRTVLDGFSVIRNSARSRNRAAENIQSKEKRSARWIDPPGGLKSGSRSGMFAIKFENDSDYPA
jgi:hypothetical protein